MKIYTKGITHSGKFHADDVFSTALLKILNPEFTVTRVSYVPDNINDCIVYDIGRGAFDHHAEEVKLHENGKPYASFGLLWDQYGEYVTKSPNAKKRLEEKFVSVIDDCDNGGERDMVSVAISSFNPPWNSDADRDEAFNEAVNVALIILNKMIIKECAVDEADAEIMKASKNIKDNIVVLERFAPWEKILTQTEAKFVVYPSMRGGYNVQGVPVEEGSREVKVPFPSEWCGLENEQLEAISKIDGMKFCHNSGFLIAVNSLETALIAARKAMEE